MIAALAGARDTIWRESHSPGKGNFLPAATYITAIGVPGPQESAASTVPESAAFP